MLRVAIRRVLWAIPTLFGISLVVFFVTTLMPDPAAAVVAAGVYQVRMDREVRDTLVARRRAHFLDMPRFANMHPEDVRSRTEAAVAAITGDDPRAAAEAIRELARLGGASLPYVLPDLDELRPAQRGKVATALALVASRMGFGEAHLDDPVEAVSFWRRFWEDRAVDFTKPSVHRVVSRITEEQTAQRVRDVYELDTFALPELIAALEDASDPPVVARLSALASHVTGRRVDVPPDANPAVVRRAKGDWLEWWFVYREDFVPLQGGERVAARFADTRYGKWMMRCAKGRFGVSSRDGEPILDKVVRRAPVTFALTGASLFFSYALAIPFGVVAAVRRGRFTGVVLAVGLFALYSLPTFWLAEILARAAGPAAVHLASIVPAGPPHPLVTRTGFVLAVAALSAGSVAVLSRYERASLLEVLRQDYIRTARAKGVSAWRELTVHALRNALMPVVMLAGLQLPTSFGAAFVVEEVFKLPGMGYETLRAVEAHDAPWLTMVLLVLSLVSMLGFVVTDVAAGLLDPRVRDTMTARAGGSRS